MPTIINGITLGGKPVYDDPAFLGCNVFASHCGAGRYGVGYFAMARADFGILNAQANSTGDPISTFPLVMTCPNDQGPGLNIQVVLAGATPLSVSVGNAQNIGNHPTDMVQVKVVDQRKLRFTPIDKRYNMMSQAGTGFSWDSANSIPRCYPSTLKSGTEPWTWSDIVADIGNGCPAMPAGAPTWIPYNLKWPQTPLARLVDDLMSRLYYVVGWDINANQWTCNTPGKMNGANTAMFNQAVSANTAGGVIARNLSNAPSKFLVGFTSFNTVNSSDPYDLTGGYATTKTYLETVNNLSQSPTQPLACGEAIALWDGSVFSNEAQLQAIADDLAPRAYAAMTPTTGEYEYAGIWPFSPDGAIRGVMWVSDGEGARTVIRINNDRDFKPLDDIKRVMEAWSNQLVTGIGISNVGMDSGSGNRQVWGGVASGATPLKIISARAYFNSVTPLYTGAARYNASIGVGSVAALDPDSNFRPPDANMTFPMTPNAIAVDVYEGGSAAAGTCVITAGSIVLGTQVGTDNETPSLPVFYFSSAPSGTLFKVLLTPNADTPGSQGTATTAATWAYDVFMFDGSDLQLASNQQPDAPRPFGQLTQAGIGWAYIGGQGSFAPGSIQLAEAIEPPITAPCTPAAPDVAARAFAYFVAG